MRFFNSSALVKISIEEKGTDRVKNIYKSEEILVSDITKIEILSVFGRILKGGLIDNEMYFHLVADLKFDLKNRFYVLEICKSLNLINITSEIISDLNLPYILRSLDALQLASAIIYREFFPDVIFVSSDKKLHIVAEAKGFMVENPEEY